MKALLSRFVDTRQEVVHPVAVHHVEQVAGAASQHAAAGLAPSLLPPGSRELPPVDQRSNASGDHRSDTRQQLLNEAKTEVAPLHITYLEDLMGVLQTS